MPQIEQALSAIRQMGLTAHSMPGATRTAIGITGNTQAVDARRLEVLPGVMELIRVTKPYKLASREMHPDDSTVATAQTRIGPGTFTIMAGPCSVENEKMITDTAEFLISRSVHLMRAGAFKPRSSPYSFQGMELEGLRLLEMARERTGDRHRERIVGTRPTSRPSRRPRTSSRSARATCRTLRYSSASRVAPVRCF